ncbi:MAG: response regulator, partial [Chromatocurvus sp.]
MRMLLVEDDVRLRDRVAAHFRDTGWAVEVAGDVREADFIAREHPCDAAIVDLGLPDGSGVALIAGWRRAGIEFPVLILTARADWRDKVEGLESGADDYVT